MNRNHSRKTPFSVKAATAVLVASAFFSSAHAQDANPNGFDLPPVEDSQNQLQPAKPAYKLPEGASVGDANDRIKTLSSQGAEALKALQGAAVSNEREMNDVESRSKDLREIQALEMQVTKAKLAKDLYQIINGDEDKAKEELDAVKGERDELSVQVKSLEQQLVDTSKQLQSQVGLSHAPDPVVVRVVGAGGHLSAQLLVPYTGETLVQSGDVLSTGHKVTSIGPNGVIVSKDGETRRLAFGKSVPAMPRQ